MAGWGPVYEVTERKEQFRGPVFRVVTDKVTMPDGSIAARDYLKHTGAVGVVALDDQDRVVLVRQYRHAVRGHLWELPAGLIDVAGEDQADAARRELAEEADLRAATLDWLIDVHTTPGCSDELIRLFLARELTEIPAPDRHNRVAEEAEMQVRRVQLADAVRMIFAGEITNAAAVAGILAALTLCQPGPSARDKVVGSGGVPRA